MIEKNFSNLLLILFLFFSSSSYTNENIALTNNKKTTKIKENVTKKDSIEKIALGSLIAVNITLVIALTYMMYLQYSITNSLHETIKYECQQANRSLLRFADLTDIVKNFLQNNSAQSSLFSLFFKK